MMKNVVFFGVLLICACQGNSSFIREDISLSGKTMGTTYHITYESHTDYQKEIDSLLVDINMEVSTYIPTSTISRFNTMGELEIDASGPSYFVDNYKRAVEIFEATDGNFDPTVMPLVNYWGFGYTQKRAVTEVDVKQIDIILKSVGLDKVNMSTDNSDGKDVIVFKKQNPEVQLDFSALAKGYAVDEVGRYLEKQGVSNYMVEIGGETVGKGTNSKSKPWTIAINTPSEDASISDYQAIIQLENKAIATSGNYRNYYDVDGVKYAHTINPKTGMPEKNTLLSTSIFAKDCMTADAYATACMVMGLDKAMALIEQTENIEGYFIYSDEEGNMKVKQTAGMDGFIVK